MALRPQHHRPALGASAAAAQPQLQLPALCWHPVRLALLLLLLHSWTLLPAYCSPSSFPHEHNTYNLVDTSKQVMGQYGPRYPDREWMETLALAVTPWTGGSIVTRPGSQQPQAEGTCRPGSFVIMTLTNDVGMRMVSSLIQSLHAHTHPDARGRPQPLSASMLVVTTSHGAFSSCEHLRSRYDHTCVFDQRSGIHDGRIDHPTFKSLSFGYVKTRHILNALTAADVIWLDADVIALRNPVPLLASLDADIAVGTAECGSTWPVKGASRDIDAKGNIKGSSAAKGLRAERHLLEADDAQEQEGEEVVVDASAGGSGGAEEAGGASTQRRQAAAEGALPGGKYSTGVVLYRSTAPVMRCLYSLLVDLWWQTDLSPSVWEQERFGAVMPECAARLRVRLAALPRRQFPTLCGQALSEGARAEAVLVHAAHKGHFLDRRDAVNALLGANATSAAPVPAKQGPG